MQNEKLSVLAQTKCHDQLSAIADRVICSEDGEDYFWGVYDALEQGLSASKSKKKLYLVSDKPPDQWMDALSYLFIATSEKEIEKKLSKLTDKLTEEQWKALTAKLSKESDISAVQVRDNDRNQCVVSFCKDDDKGWRKFSKKWHGKIVDGVRLTASYDPKGYTLKSK